MAVAGSGKNSPGDGPCRQLREKLDKAGFRVEIDSRSEKLGYKIREAQGMKVPYMLIVGDQDIENHTVSVRHRSGADLGPMPYDSFEAMLKEEQNNKVIR